ncbi:MAG TPA: DM13 domain-containing protein [Pseudonocardia sp.]|nr:DM13 domain-containing protein [Pseudonocardia sp.]
MTTRSRPLRRRLVLTTLTAVAVLLVAGLALFQPWKLLVDRMVSEPAPTTVAPAEPPPRVLARGELITHEHATTGSVLVLGLADGSRVLRLQDLDTSDGPLLKVLITDAPVLPGVDGWGVFDDGRQVDLGELKGNIGSSNYVLPADVDLAQLRSVSIWCDRFNVSFGAAALAPVAA